MGAPYVMPAAHRATAPESAGEAWQRARLFYALWPDEGTRNRLARLPGMLAVSGGRCTPADKLHLTLAFLGPQAAVQVPRFAAVLARLPTEPIDMTIDRFGVFRRHRIVWAGLREVPATLTGLQHALLDALAGCGVALPAPPPFRPHVTLMRDVTPLPAVDGPDPGMPFTPIRWRADSLTLVASVDAPTGPRYDILASRILDGRRR